MNTISPRLVSHVRSVVRLEAGAFSKRVFSTPTTKRLVEVSSFWAGRSTANNFSPIEKTSSKESTAYATLPVRIWGYGALASTTALHGMTVEAVWQMPVVTTGTREKNSINLHTRTFNILNCDPLPRSFLNTTTSES